MKQTRIQIGLTTLVLMMILLTIPSSLNADRLKTFTMHYTECCLGTHTIKAKYVSFVGNSIVFHNSNPLDKIKDIIKTYSACKWSIDSVE